jgi:hypothetical protein
MKGVSMQKLGIGMLLFLLAIAACGKKTQEKAIEEAIEKESKGKVDVDLDKGKITMKSEDGEVEVDAGKAVELPKEFPKDVYVYKGAKIIMSMKIPEGQLITLQSKDDPEKVIENYKQKLTAKGWSQKAFMNLTEQRIFVGQKDSRMVNVMAIKVEDVTQIRVSVSKK